MSTRMKQAEKMARKNIPNPRYGPETGMKYPPQIPFELKHSIAVD